jgi:uncharacterized Zn finger protein
MTAATLRKPTRKPAAAPAPVAWDLNDAAGIVHIARGDEPETGYFLDLLADGSGVLLTKIRDRVTYHVTVEDVARCNCRGFNYHGRCKHAAAMAEMIEAGLV